MPVVALGRKTEFTRPNPKVDIKESDGLLPEQLAAIAGQKNINIGFTGAWGNLVRNGFVRDGLKQMGTALRENPFQCVMIGNKNLKYDQVPDFLEGGYILHPQYGVMSRAAFEKCVDDIGLKLLIAATPTKVHLDDVRLGLKHGIDTHVEKPAFRVNHSTTERLEMLEAVKTGRISLIDFFYYSDPIIEFFMNLDRYMDGLGDVLAVRGSCFEPHSVLTESNGTRWKMLFDEDINGGTLGADQQPHPLVMISGFLKRKFGISLKPENIDTIYRAMDLDVRSKAENEGITLPKLSETTMALAGTFRPHGGRSIRIESINGKGLEVPGSDKNVPLPTYILEVECEKATIKVGLGDLQGGCAPHISIIPKDVSIAPSIKIFRNGGNGYKLCLADAVAKAIGSKDLNILTRLNEQTEASFAALDILADTRERMLANPDLAHVHLYRGDQQITLPEQFTVPNVDGWVEYNRPKKSTLQQG